MIVSTIRPLSSVASLGIAILMCANSTWAASNEAALLIEADTGKVLHAENAHGAVVPSFDHKGFSDAA